jgi:hypothetical protein
MRDQELADANEARLARLRGAGVPVPIDEMYMVSLLEFVLGDKLEEARNYHDHRVAIILAKAEANLEVMLEQMNAAQARQTLLGN